MKIRFIYHKGQDSWVGKGIVYWTFFLALVRFDWKSLKFNFSHVEIHFPDEDGEFRIGKRKNNARYVSTGLYLNPMKYRYRGRCFSSTTRGDAEGVRFAPASEVLHHPDRWMYQEHEVDDEIVKVAGPVMRFITGYKYDFAGLFGFFLPWNPEKPDRYYCSELCAWLAWQFRLVHQWHKRISPRRLAKVLGGELKPLI